MNNNTWSCYTRSCRAGPPPLWPYWPWFQPQWNPPDSWTSPPQGLRPPGWYVGDPKGAQLSREPAGTEGKGREATPLGGAQALTTRPVPAVPSAQNMYTTARCMDRSLSVPRSLLKQHIFREASLDHPTQNSTFLSLPVPFMLIIFLPGLSPPDMTY